MMNESGLAPLLQVALVLFLVFANGFFVAAEFSLVTIRRSRIEEMVNEGHGGARRVEGVLKDLDTVISSTQLGITMASLALGWTAEPFLSHLIEPWLAFLPAGAVFPTARSISAALAFAVITYLHIVLGELAPKSLALQRAERVALTVAAPMILFTRLFQPFIRLLNGSGNLFLRILGVHGGSESESVHSREELLIILNKSEERGVLQKQETEIIERVFDFGSLIVRQVMVPRTEMVCIPLDATLDETLSIVTKASHTNFPVYKEDADDIVGMVRGKDLLAVLYDRNQEWNLKSVMRAPVVVPEMIHIDDLLAQFRRNKTHMAIVVDEFGGTAGLVTIQDVLEEIVGDVSETLDEDEVDIALQDDGSVLINGKMPLTDLNARFGLDLEDPHHVTLGGLVFDEIGRRPRIGDDVEAEGVHFRVEALDGLRVALVRMTLPDGVRADERLKQQESQEE